MSLKIKRTDNGDVTVLELDGDLKLGEASTAFSETIRDLIKRGRVKLVIVYKGVRYVDSAGNGNIVAAYTMARNAGGEVVLAGLPKRYKDLLQITRLLTVFNCFDSIPEALSYFAKGPADGTS